MGVLPSRDPSQRPAAPPQPDRGLKDAAAAGAGPAGHRQRLPCRLDAAVVGATRLVGRKAGAGPGSCSGAAGNAAKAREAAAGAMAAPSPGPREVGADPREDRRGKGWWAGVGPPLGERRGHDPIQAREGPCSRRRAGHAPHGAPGMPRGGLAEISQHFLSFLIGKMERMLKLLLQEAVTRSSSHPVRGTQWMPTTGGPAAMTSIALAPPCWPGGAQHRRME